MRVALISDIHANLPALEAVLEDIENQSPDSIFCLGDLVGYAPWPNEVIREMRKKRIPVIAGNYDEGIGKGSDDCGCAYKTDRDKELGAISIAYTNNIIKPEERAYLNALPRHFRIEFGAAPIKLQMLMVHGSPRKLNEYLFEDRPEESMKRILEQSGADILLFGHTHQPYYRKLSYEAEGRALYRHAVNTGSVGKPKDGDPRACYVMVEVDENTSRNNPDSLRIVFRRIAYDVEKAAQAIEESHLPNEYADMLRKAY